METLFVLLNAIAPLSPELEAYLRSILRCKKFLAGDIILQEGKICDRICFIESGLIIIFKSNDGKQITTWILKEGDIFISVNSFFLQIPSEEGIFAIEPTTVWLITHAELEDVCKKFPEFMVHRDKIKEKYYLISNQRQLDMTSFSPEKKYAQLIENNPDILHRVPLKYIYSYLDMSKATFTRVRSSYVPTKK